MTTKIGTSITEAAALLDAGQLVGIPTETVYGLAGNGLDPAIVAKIFAAKDRPSFDPMILHTDHLGKVEQLLYNIPEALQLLADKFMPGPLSILVDRRSSVPDITTAGLDKVAIRIPSHPMTRELLGLLDYPLAAPSANPFGYVSPTTALHVQDQLGDRIPYILDGGACSVGLESTIVEWDGHTVVVLRKGGIAVEEIEKIVGKVVVVETSTSNPKAPGMLHSHYAPKVKMTLDRLDSVLSKYDKSRIGYLGWDSFSSELPVAHQKVLSSSADLSEAARNLFTHIRSLDQLDLDIIVACETPEHGLGRAINDKLKRASA